MRYLSVCSGIEAATVAWHPLGWEPAAFSEIEPFPRAVLAHRFPGVPIHGDFTTLGGDEYGAIDLLVGGTPCQSFSIAGLRGGLGDDRGNLALEFLRLAQRTRARWVVWENVPGVLSSNGGRDFGSILGGLVELGYGFAYRVLDAQFFGVPQRRRRVFVVGYLGDWRRAAAVLFERDSLSGNPAPRRETRQGTARAPEGCATFRWQNENDGIVADPVAASLRAKGTTTDERSVGAYVAQSSLYSIMPMNSGKDYKAREVEVAQPLMTSPVGGNQGGDFVVQSVAFAQNTRNEVRLQGGDGQIAGALAAEPGMKQTTYIAQAYDLRGREDGSQFEGPHDTANIRAASGGSSRSYVAAVAFQSAGGVVRELGDVMSTLDAARESRGTNQQRFIQASMGVRRLTPRECERLQGFPDDWTLVPYRGREAADGLRYKAIGNSMAVPVMRWIGQRIQMVLERD